MHVDFAKSQKAMSSCQFCYGQNDEPPKAAVLAMGTRAYLSCTLTEELTEGHCYIVPIQHHFCMLEADDDVWDEVRVSVLWSYSKRPGAHKSVACSSRAILELHEMPDSNVGRCWKGHDFLRDRHQLQVAETYLH